MEIWKDIQGYEGLYQVSNLGKIKSLDRIIKANKDGGKRLAKGELKTLQKGWHGYLWVALCKNGKSKTYSVHRLVALAFIENKENMPQVNHIDGNKENNSVGNLEWCDDAKNIRHALYNGLVKNAKSVRCIETGEVFVSSGEAQRLLGVSGRTIRNVCSGKGSTAGRFHWEFA